MNGSPPVRLMNFNLGRHSSSSGLISRAVSVGFFQMLHILQRIGQRYVSIIDASVGTGLLKLDI